MSDDPIQPLSFKDWQQAEADGKFIRDQVKVYGQLLYDISQFALFSFSISVEVFLRYDFGERYLKPLAALLGFGWIYLIYIAYGEYHDGAQALLYFGYTFLAVCGLHIVWIQIRNQFGYRWHSKSTGVPWAPLTWIAPSQVTLFLLIEPGIVIGLALFAVARDQQLLGQYLIAAAVALVGKYLIQRAHFREKLLDAIDSQIESEVFAEALKGTPSPRKALGFIVPGAGKWHSYLAE